MMHRLRIISKSAYVIMGSLDVASVENQHLEHSSAFVALAEDLPSVAGRSRNLGRCHRRGGGTLVCEPGRHPPSRPIARGNYE
jgi:hypothetical protein